MRDFRSRMLASAEERGSRVVLALDLWDPYDLRLRRAEEVLNKSKGGIAAVKVNHHLLLPYGLQGISSIISICKDEGLPLIADLKMNDIESTNLNIVDSLLAHGFDGLIANPFVGFEEGLGEPVKRLHASQAGVLLLVYMSHKGAAEGYSLVTAAGEPIYRLFAERAKKWKADGVVVSAKSREILAETRKIVGVDSLIFAVGVGFQGGSLREARASGADFGIVGRTVTESQNPAKVLKALNGED